MPIPLTKTCPECEQEMELITSDVVGEVLVYECAECGYQEEIRVERDEDLDRDDLQSVGIMEALDEDDDEDELNTDDAE
jgi:Zn ribbon nucleic-acid-binding protein